ncbi:unnamed protein product, partial [Mesorhabditis belari]|uniref:Apple domain-containing protein n=1 Tax=Mesorhabditis belari TaxID=2138241 RepID=A0AAF3JBY2_9BILA
MIPNLSTLFLLCIQISTILAWERCFEKSPNHVLLASARGKPKKIPLERCMKMCLDASGTCRSFVYFNTIGVCILNAGDRTEKPDRFVASNEGVDYYHRICYHSPPRSLAPWSHDEPLADECFEVAQGKVLIGIVDQLLDQISSIDVCQKSCLNAKKTSGIVCKSAMWYPKEKECIIASQDKADIAELYIDDPNSVYLENKCAEPGKEMTSTSNNVTPSPPISSTTSSLTSLLGGVAAAGAEDDGGDEQPFHVEGELPVPAVGGPPDPPQTSAFPPALPPSQPPPIEQSGYDKSGVNNAGMQAELQPPSIPKTLPTIDPKIIDSYQMPLKKEEAAVESKTTPINDYYGKAPNLGVDAAANTYQTPPVKSLPVETPISANGYRRRRLSEHQKGKCFKQVHPESSLFEDRVMKAYSIEQCIDICRLCVNCIRGQPCSSLAFDMLHENCALSANIADNRGQRKAAQTIAYYTRNPIEIC